jgi:DNA polymerase III subunit gamma/tau
MSSVTLARKWRPQRFEDVIGQSGVVRTLKNAIASGRVAQSFIFAGPRGVGKTTTARILARALNCVKGPTPEPCGKCDACVEIAEGRDVDVLEIDGATYTGVDAVREVIVEPLAIAPMRDRFKVFIIDEVHRLSKNAFDALLKSIEEPPPYVKFMMATTDLHSVPDTIQSRSQVFELRTLPFAAIRDQLRTVTSKEKVTIDDTALSLIARSAEGSMRDGLSALDQVLAFTSEDVTAENVSTVLGLIGRDVQFDIVDAVAREDLAAAFSLAGAVVDAGFDLRIVCRELARLTRDLMVVKIDPSRIQDPEIASESERERLQALAGRSSREDLMRAFDLLAKAEADIRVSSQPRHAFEMALVKWVHVRQLTPLTELIRTLGGAPGPVVPKPVTAPAAPPKPVAAAGASPVPKPPVPAAATPKPPATPEVSPKPPATPEVPPKPPATHEVPPKPQAKAEEAEDIKPALMASIREQNKVFFGMVIAQAEIAIEGDAVVFTFAPVHKALRAQLEAKRTWLEQLARTASGRKMSIVTRERAPSATAATPDAAVTRQQELRARAKARPEVQAVLDVFGGEIEDVEEIEPRQ